MFCLAVVHHLALTNTVPLDEIVGFLADFGAPVVVEFPHRDDVMASRLLARKRDGVFDAYDRPHWETALTSPVRRSAPGDAAGRDAERSTTRLLADRRSALRQRVQRHDPVGALDLVDSTTSLDPRRYRSATYPVNVKPPSTGR